MKHRKTASGIGILFFFLFVTFFAPFQTAMATDQGYYIPESTATPEELTFTFYYGTGTDYVTAYYAKLLIQYYCPVPVEISDDLTTAIQYGYIVGKIYYPDLEPLTTEFIYFITLLDQVVKQSNYYNITIQMIEWLKQFVPAVSSEPEPPPSSDEVPADFSGVVWLHTNVSGWKQSSTLSSVSVSSSSITLNYDKANSWPQYSSSEDLNANPWIFVKQDGTWYAATWEWLRKGQTTKSVSAVDGSHIKVSPLNNFKPKSGTKYGFMVSGLARDSKRNVYERTNVKMITWP